MDINLQNELKNCYLEQYNLINNCLNNQKINSWIITGKKGIGKASLVKLIAKEVFNQSNAHIELSNHPDFKLIEKIEDKEISIEQIREIIGFARITSSISAKKIVIIDDIDFLNKNAANALLKILEEPPKNLFIFLITHQPHTVLETINSRCAKIKLALNDHDYAKTILVEKLGFDEEEALMYLVLTNNSIGEAVAFKEIKIKSFYEELLQSLQNLSLNDISKLTQVNNKVLYFITLRLSRLLFGFFDNKYILSCEKDFLQNMNYLNIPIAYKLELWEDINKKFLALEYANLDYKHCLYLILNQIRQVSL
ncbi:AAA family ATPase [Rickettsiales endosymbiont of Stachyamoeba lipophora]|uniref:AAA family ATPase n=1 Tax=Rickettsiales endosymbiont of Stachyamoeba lipophora TaxID=2486578 RepID=UPI000F653751|nr:AAA family ATPase [Rickettsiales endosymbiont of Stachyamoeba lipophora]AZL15111.1 AAA family ATPase [Rickettsiales endosymbiont of Stachyamoeba lipophora]